MDDTDFDLLCEGLSAEEAKRMRKILVEWCDGDENGFPVQLGLLTRAQWRTAASVPRLVNDSRKLIELHLAEYRRQTKALVDDFSGTTRKRTEELKTAAEAHARAAKETASAINANLSEVEAVASQIRDKLDAGASQWERALKALGDERLKFQKVCDDLDDRLAWWHVFWSVLGGLLILAIGIGVGHYVWTR